VRNARDPALAAFLEEIYSACNKRERLKRDPLAVVREYDSGADRELAALVCSTLAFGGVDLILAACRRALSPLGERPALALSRMGESEIAETWAGFQYRYCFAKDMTALMLAAKRAIEEAGSLERYFLRSDPGGPDVAAAAGAFARGLKRLGRPAARRRVGRGHGATGPGADSSREKGIRENLLPEPERGSACKRLFLYLRWMARRDEIDPGDWRGLDPARLLVPLDLHMVRVCRERLGFLPSRAATLRNALIATEAFRLYAPEDPAKYDFALTRPGIDPEPGDERFGCA
jgi:uncharacterized protein (TIGR02757 family)